MKKEIELSFEFFPPKTEKGMANLTKTWRMLDTFNPSFYSVTYGAGGSTQDKTASTVLAIHQDLNKPVAPHISCVGSSQEKVTALLDYYREQDIKHIVALRGDLPSGVGLGRGEFRYAADLVKAIRAHSGDAFHIEVAAYPEMHPEAKNIRQDLAHFKMKVDAGANSAITQYFFNISAYESFVEDCQRMGIEIPIIPGLMPIQNLTGLMRFSKLCEAELPRWLVKRLEAYGDDVDSIRAYGIDVVSRLAQDLISKGAPGIHLYTLNQIHPTIEICKNVFA